MKCSALLTFAVLPLVVITGGALPSHAAAPAPLARPQSAHPRIVVQPFSFGSISPWWNGDWQIGQGVAALVSDELVHQGIYDVYAGPYERMPASGLVLRGTITRFDFDRDDIGFSDRERGRGWGHRRSSPSLFGLGYSQTRANVTLNCQLIDASTGRILRTFTAAGQSSKGSFTGFGIQRGGSGIWADGVDFRSPSFQKSLLGDATRRCVSDLAHQLGKSANSRDIVSAASSCSGKVADVDGDEVTINLGADQGIRIGDRLEVEAPGKVIRDPDTGQVLDERIEHLGSIRITSLTAHTATGLYSGKLHPQIGDSVRLD